MRSKCRHVYNYINVRLCVLRKLELYYIVVLAGRSAILSHVHMSVVVVV